GRHQQQECHGDRVPGRGTLSLQQGQYRSREQCEQRHLPERVQQTGRERGLHRVEHVHDGLPLPLLRCLLACAIIRAISSRSSALVLSTSSARCTSCSAEPENARCMRSASSADWTCGSGCMAAYRWLRSDSSRTTRPLSAMIVIIFSTVV